MGMAPLQPLLVVGPRQPQTLFPGAPHDAQALRCMRLAQPRHGLVVCLYLRREHARRSGRAKIPAFGEAPADRILFIHAVGDGVRRTAAGVVGLRRAAGQAIFLVHPLGRPLGDEDFIFAAIGVFVAQRQRGNGQRRRQLPLRQREHGERPRQRIALAPFARAPNRQHLAQHRGAFACLRA